MKSRGVVGKKIVKIHQTRLPANTGELTWCVTSIELEDGTLLRPHTLELDDHDVDGYGTMLIVVKRKKVKPAT